MKFPWTKKPETRQSYSNQIITALHQAALGRNADVAATSPAVAAAGLLARSLAAATVTPQSTVTRPINAHWLYDCGQSLVYRGEHVSLLEVDSGTLRITPATEWEITGSSPYKNAWRYRLTIPTPSGVIKRRVSGESVVHIRIPDFQHPWQGCSPLAAANVTSDAMGTLEDYVREELQNATRAKLLALADWQDADPDDEDDPWQGMIADLQNSKSKTLLVPMPSTQVQGIGAASSPPAPGTTILAPDISENIQTARDRLIAGLYAALGMMPQLFEGGEATGVREAKRAFGNLTLAPIAKLLTAELSDVLETPITLDFASLQLGAIREAASTAKMLVDIGMDRNDALAKVGLN